MIEPTLSREAAAELLSRAVRPFGEALHKPASLAIVAEGGRLVGTDAGGRRWRISWCANGRYSYWFLSRDGNEERGWYVYINPLPGNPDWSLVEQIKNAERKYGIYL